MKKTIITLLAVAPFVLASCGGGANGDELAQEVCDCYKKANGMDASDPKRTEEQQKCLKLNTEKWGELKDNAEEAAKFNTKVASCGKEMIQESLGQ